MASLRSRYGDLHKIRATGSVHCGTRAQYEGYRFSFWQRNWPQPSLPIFVPRVLDLHTLGQFPTRLNVLPSRLSLSSLALHLPFSLALPSSLPSASDVPRNPFSCRWRQKRGSTPKKRKKTNVFLLPRAWHFLARLSRRVYCGHDTQRALE